MSTIVDAPLPETSLLARHRGPECYRDAFTATVLRQVTLGAYIEAFYSSGIFLPERKLLGLIGRGADRQDIGALSRGEAESFAAWDVEARGDDQVLLRDFRNRTCSWLWVEPVDGGTRLWFGSGVRDPEAPLMHALLPFHTFYSRRLLEGAVRRLG